MIKKKGEDAKVAIRSIRRDANETIKKNKKDGEITEDDQKKMEEDAQKATDSFIKDVDKIVTDKEKEIMEV
ncbi:Ribosome-recycling factor [bioreactor metagenome]|uniref:Ribosome-recycling factor n=1 Tax=bioreactor metagenome TaxID=1076179 RepID=A0A645ITB0_9ZZZZ